MKKLFSAIGILLASLELSAQNGPVKMWEGVENLPTYRVNAPEKAPLFERDFAYQRAKRGVYPYAMNDNPTIENLDSDWSIIQRECTWKRWKRRCRQRSALPEPC